MKFIVWKTFHAFDLFFFRLSESKLESICLDELILLFFQNVCFFHIFSDGKDKHSNVLFFVPIFLSDRAQINDSNGIRTNHQKHLKLNYLFEHRCHESEKKNCKLMSPTPSTMFNLLIQRDRLKIFDISEFIEFVISICRVICIIFLFSCNFVHFSLWIISIGFNTFEFLCIFLWSSSARKFN